eukprot:7065974-Alexandrium_andersonii.AAC.1
MLSARPASRTIACSVWAGALARPLKATTNPKPRGFNLVRARPGNPARRVVGNFGLPLPPLPGRPHVF